MNKVVLIIGLPGSGKTYLAKKKYVPMGYTLIDDPSVCSTMYRGLLYQVNKGNDIVVTDALLCKKSIRKKAIVFFNKKGYEVTCVFFENDEKKCKRLLKLRNDDRVITSFKAFDYTIPKYIIPEKIYGPK